MDIAAARLLIKGKVLSESTIHPAQHLLSEVDSASVREECLREPIAKFWLRPSEAKTCSLRHDWAGSATYLAT